jgi:hypothetical protein
MMQGEAAACGAVSPGAAFRAAAAEWQSPRLPALTTLPVLACVVPLLLGIALSYTFLASSGTFHEIGRQPEWRTDYYDRMAEGFRGGHLYIPTVPAPELLAAKDPYTDAAVPHGLWDASLYQGRYYLYWGPVPGLLLLAFKLVTGITHTISDQYLVLAFSLGRLCAGALLLLGLARALAAAPPLWLLTLAIAVFGLAGPTPFTVASPNVYEACLLCGQCFLLTGLWAALLGLQRSSRRVPLFLAAGVCWALALGSRVTLLLAVPSLVLLTLGLLVWHGRRALQPWWPVLRRMASPALALGLPPLAALGAYGWYNYARFGSATEFGVSYQISPQWFWTHEAFVLPNLFSYLWAPLQWSCRFPYVLSYTHRPLSSLLTWPPGYQTFERVSGVLVMAPWCYLALLWIWRGLRACWQRVLGLRLPREPRLSLPELWALGCAFAILPVMLPALWLWEASMRYSGDALSGALVAASLGAFWLYRRAQAAHQPQRLAATTWLLAALGLYTCFVGLLSGYASYDDPFLVNNPGLHHWLRVTLSVCTRGA